MVQTKKRIKKSALFSALMTATALLLVWKYMPRTEQPFVSILSLVVQLFLFFHGGILFIENKNSRKILACGFGFLFAAVQICGKRLDLYETIASNATDYISIIFQSAVCSPLIGGYFLEVLKKIKNKNNAEFKYRKKEKIVFLVSWIGLVVCWLPYLAAYYPGLYTYDVSYQFLQYSTRDINTHHPLLHTLLIGWFYDLGWYLFGYPVKGILLHSLFQMIVLAAAIAGAIAFLYSKNIPIVACIVVFAINALLPINCLLSISTTKDVMFSATVLWLTILVLRAATEGWEVILADYKWKVKIVLAVALAGLLRNNGFICGTGLLVSGICMALQKRKGAIRFTALICVGLILVIGTNAVLKVAVKAEKGPKREVFSIPVQQLARVYTRTDDEAKDRIKYFLPKASNYAPTIADAVKDTFKPEETGVLPFLQLWAEVGLRNPQVYVDAFLETNQGFWDLGLYPAGQYLETKFHTDKGKWLMEDSKWPQLRETVTELYSRNSYWKIPVYRIILSPAFWTWMLVGAMFLAWIAKKNNVLVAGVAVLGVFLTTLLGPCVMMRYGYAVTLCAPVLMTALLAPKTEHN